MGEGVEAVLAVVGAHAAGPHPAEGELLHAEVHDGVVDAEAAAARVPREPLGHAVPRAEHVQRQRLVAAVDQLDGGLGGLGRHDGQDGAEYFLLEVLQSILCFNI